MPMVLLKSVPVPVPVLLFCSIGQERSGAESGVEFALGIALEGKQTNRCVKCVAGKVKQGALPFRCVSPGITPVGGRLTPCILWAKNKPTNASATRMRTNSKPRMGRSELLEVITVFILVVSFFGCLSLIRRRPPCPTRGREGPIKALPLSASDRRRALVLREW